MCVNACTVIHRCLLDELRLYVVELRGGKLSAAGLCFYRASKYCVCNTFKHSFMDALADLAMYNGKVCHLKENFLCKLKHCLSSCYCIVPNFHSTIFL